MAAAHDPELDYLLPGFDPSSLTVARLRLILVSHDVGYPASAKKPQLIDIFNQQVVPQSRKILGARARTKRTSKGITDADAGAEDESADGGAEVGSMPPPARPRSPRKKTPRPSSGRATDTPEGDDVTRATPRKTAGRKSTVKHSRVSDTDSHSDAAPTQASPRKSRKSEATVAVKVEEPELPEPRSGGGDESVFSDDNPFQSGSSPLSGANEERRRKSAGAVGAARRKSGGQRRKTDGFPGRASVKAEDGIVVPSAERFEVSSVGLQARPKQDEVAVGEEFTPEEQIELSREHLQEGARRLASRRLGRASSATGGGGVGRSAPWVVLLTLLGGYAVWWRQEKLAVGYCGVGRAPMSMAKVEVPDWASMLRPQCQACPAHAYCYAELQTRCEHDFVLQPHPLSLWGLVPLAPSCEPDGEKVRKVKAVADRAVDELRERRAKFECGEPVGGGGAESPATVTVDEAALKQEVGKRRRRGMSEEEFEELWRGAVDEMVEREEVVSQVDE